MKNLILFLTSFVIINSMHSQGYKPVTSDNFTWNIVSAACDAGANFQYFSSRDSSNKNVIFSTIRNAQNESLGYIKEDTLVGQMSFYDFSSNETFKFYDMSLKIGDSFTFINKDSESEEFKVAKIYYINSLKHISFDGFNYFCSPQDSIKFIEGVGSTSGYNFADQYFGNSVLLCTKKNDTTFYSNPYFDGKCFLDNLVAVEEIKTIPIITIQDNRIHIDNQGVEGRLELFNIIGSKIGDFKVNVGVNSINASTFNLNVIIYKLTIDNKQYSDKLLILKN